MNLYNYLSGKISVEELQKRYNAKIYYEFLPNKINYFIFINNNSIYININSKLSNNEKKRMIIIALSQIEINKFNNIDILINFKNQKNEANDYLNILKNYSKTNKL